MHRLVYLLSILCLMAWFPSVVKGKSGNDSLETLIKSNPEKIVSSLTPRFQKPNASTSDLLLLSQAYLSLGKYYVLDSLIDYVFEHYSFKQDSAKYMSFLLIEAENKKILEMFDESLNLLNQIFDYTKRKGNPIELLDVYLKFAEYYRSTNHSELALIYLDKTNELGWSIRGGFPPVFKAQMMNRRAAVYHEKDIYLDSVELLSKAVIQSFAVHQSSNLVASSSNQLGYLYLHDNNPNAERYFKNAIAIWDELGFNNSAHNARLNLARLYIKKRRSQEAIKLALVCLKTTQEYGWRWDECYWKEILAKAYEQLHNYKLALHYLNEAKAGLVQLSSTQYKERLAYYSNKLEIRRREDELKNKSLEVLKVQNEVITKTDENLFLFYLLSIAFIILLVSGIFIIIIGRQKKQVKIQKDKIGKINKRLQQLLKQKEILLKEVNHRVKNNLSVLAGLMYLKEKELKDEFAINIVKDMQGRINTISLIHETLYQRDDVEHINFQEYLERLLTQIMALNPYKKKVSIDINCNGFNPVLSLAMPLSMMMNELITNSLKHAFKDVEQPFIKIEYNPLTRVLTYTDNGPGYDMEVLNGSLGQKLLRILATQIDAEMLSEREENRMKVKICLTEQTR